MGTPNSERQGDRETERQGESCFVSLSPCLRLLVFRRLPAPVSLSSTQGSRDKFHELGPEKFAQWVLAQDRLLLTDTTFRDAHQSLLATRMRTYDMVKAAPFYAAHLHGLFSLEMWGGATFDASMRFLKESPWERLAALRERIPNILFQMLLRAANAVGYTNYPDNVVKSVRQGIGPGRHRPVPHFRRANWLPNLKLGIEAVRNTGMWPKRPLLHRRHSRPRPAEIRFEILRPAGQGPGKAGRPHVAIKDMAGVCKPQAARLLVKTLKQEVGIPIHFHTHDCGGSQMAAILMAAQEKVDIADAAMAPFSGMTSQVNLNTLVEALRFTPRDAKLPFDPLEQAAQYWEQVRRYYRPFESDQFPLSATFIATKCRAAN